MENGIHYRTLDQSVSAGQLTRCAGFFCRNGRAFVAIAFPRELVLLSLEQRRLALAAEWHERWPVHNEGDSVAQLLAQGDCVRKTSAVRACSAASRKRYHVPSGIRCVCCGSTSLISSTTAAKPPACKSEIGRLQCLLQPRPRLVCQLRSAFCRHAKPEQPPQLHTGSRCRSPARAHRSHRPRRRHCQAG